MQQRLFFILILLAASSSRATAGCINPFTLTHSTVGIMRYFDDNEKKEARPGVLGIRGAGWFLSPLSMVTVEHAAAAMHLSDQNWKQVEIQNGLNKQSIAHESSISRVPMPKRLPCSNCSSRFPVHKGFSSGRTHSFPRSRL